MDANGGLSYWLGVTMYIAAALEEASPEQRSKIKKAVSPLIEIMRTDGTAPESIRRQIRKILGDKWRPSEKWAGFWDLFWNAT